MFLFNNLNNGKTLREKNWQTIIYKQIPLFLYINEPEQEFAIRLIKKDYFRPSRQLVKIPNNPKTMEEVNFIYCWLQRLFTSTFEYSEFNSVFNPEFINLIFEENSQYLNIKSGVLQGFEAKNQINAINFVKEYLKKDDIENYNRPRDNNWFIRFS
uniref:Uncharacterized protein n=1 Tax=Meloidogyne enterolobii TaxID=390850 RepID=A0A6V7U583_MELEN|nr:unnamed protein product [Meloidogyne enterolobii]